MRAQKQRTIAESEATTLLQVMADPKKYKTRIDDLTDRRVAAEEAEAAAKARIEEADKFEAALVERTEKVDAREVAVQAREDVIVVRETSAAEQTEVADNLVRQSRERESSVKSREQDLERRATEAIRAVRELVKK